MFCTVTVDICPSHGHLSMAILLQVMATCLWQYYSKSWLVVQVNGHLSKQKLLVQVNAAFVRGYLSGLFVNDCLSKSRLLSVATCSSQSYSSKSRLLCQRLLVRLVGKATCPSQWPLTRAKATRPG